MDKMGSALCILYMYKVDMMNKYVKYCKLIEKERDKEKKWIKTTTPYIKSFNLYFTDVNNTRSTKELKLNETHYITKKLQFQMYESRTIQSFTDLSSVWC